MTKHSHTISKTKGLPQGRLLAFLLAIIAVMVMWAAARWPLMPSRDPAMMFPDEFYQALCCRSYRQAPLAMLTFWLGHLWTSLFGESLLVLRRLCWLMVGMANAIGALWLWRRTRQEVLSATTFFAATAAALVYCCDNYDWNVGCYPFFTLLAILTLSLWKRPTVWKATAAGAVGALMVMSKVTTAPGLLLCLIAALRFVRSNPRSAVTLAATGIGAFLLTALIFATLMCGSPAAYLAAFNADNVISGHTDWLRILDTVKRTFFPVLSMGAVIAVAMAAVPTIGRLTRRDNCTFRWLLLVGVVAGLLTIKEVILTQYVFGQFIYIPGLMLLPFALLCVAPWMKARLDGKKAHRAVTAAAATALIWPWIPAIGSDTPLVRIYVMSLLPLAVWVACEAAPKAAHRMLMVMTLAVTVTTIWFRVWEQRDVVTSHLDYSHEPRIGAILYAPGDPINERLAMLRADYEKVAALGPVVVAGPDKYYADYLLTDSTGYALNTFHYSPTNPQEFLPALLEAAASAVSVIYVSPMGADSDPASLAASEALLPLNFRPTHTPYGLIFTRLTE